MSNDIYSAPLDNNPGVNAICISLVRKCINYWTERDPLCEGIFLTRTNRMENDWMQVPTRCHNATMTKIRVFQSIMAHCSNISSKRPSFSKQIFESPSSKTKSIFYYPTRSHKWHYLMVVPSRERPRRDKNETLRIHWQKLLLAIFIKVITNGW